jgi:hypothetical protein
MGKLKGHPSLSKGLGNAGLEVDSRMALPHEIIGSWKNSDSGAQFRFTKDGEFYVNDKLEVVHQAAFDKADKRSFIRIPEIGIPFAFIWSIDEDRLTLLVSSQANPTFTPDFDSIFAGFEKRIFHKAV